MGIASVTGELEKIAGAGNVVTHAHALATYESDGLLQYQQAPAVAVLPGSADEVRQIVSLCHRESVPWVARGSGTGLSGGATGC
jgi:glycolate oxidase